MEDEIQIKYTLKATPPTENSFIIVEDLRGRQALARYQNGYLSGPYLSYLSKIENWKYYFPEEN